MADTPYCTALITLTVNQVSTLTFKRKVRVKIMHCLQVRELKRILHCNKHQQTAKRETTK